MQIPQILLKHVAKAFLNSLSCGVAGDFLFGIADDVMESWQKDCDEQARRAELESIAQAATVEVKEAIVDIVNQVAPEISDTDRKSLTVYLTHVPAAIRRRLRRPSDPMGRTAPNSLSIRRGVDLIPLLPNRIPRFLPGDHPIAGVDRELVELLGVGGFGEVWKAINPNRPSAAPVALKFCIDRAAQDRLLRHEVRLLDRVMQFERHPGIVSLRETYLKADPPCLEYEYVGGGELTALVEDYRVRGGISPQGAARIVERLARTVGNFHRLDPPIVHRDIKPANILVTRDSDGRFGLKIADFGIGGIAARREIERAQTNFREPTMHSIGTGSYTPLYASPEQIRGEKPDPRDDVHALGVLWFQLLTTDLTHGAPTGLDWVDDLTRLGMSKPQIELIASCFSFRKERRPEDALQLADRIDVLFGLRITNAPTTTVVSQPSDHAGQPSSSGGRKDTATSVSPGHVVSAKQAGQSNHMTAAIVSETDENEGGKSNSRATSHTARSESRAANLAHGDHERIVEQSVPDLGSLAFLLKQLSDATRLQLLRHLAERETNVGELTERLVGMTQPAVSHHLALLKTAGVVTSNRDGKFMFYSLTPTGRKLVRLAKSLRVAEERVVEIFSQVADPTRLEILSMLLDTSRYVGEICSILEQSQPAVSHHLAKLRASGLLEFERDGKYSIYSCTPQASRFIRSVLTAFPSE